ncbi:YpbB family protein [Carnobacterium antarcticum]|uniref:Helix-turn-helix domain-containing protein n=1 Tax=Carnobacterium antarcticum TaxID=2126436 RepID=A0ABW4NRA3_9LACT|nr:helix-turn-helix domain-containing protein [Carnobacterium sp. CP1]
MKLTYFENFCLSLFSNDVSKKSSTIYHILTGKRTASILYNAQQYRLTAYFSLFPKIKRQQFERLINKMERLELITADSEGEGYQLTEIGAKGYQQYFMKHTYPVHLNQLKNGAVNAYFWRKCLFVTQVLSEVRHGNKRYLPLEKEWKNQIWLKNWLNQHHQDKQTLAQQFGKEWLFLLNELTETNAEIIVAYLTGHGKIGKTRRQLAEHYGIEPLEAEIILTDCLAELIEWIERQPQMVPLFFSIYSETARDYSGITQSAAITQKYLLNGHSIEEIADLRRLKFSTISEHVIEISIVDPSFDLSLILPIEIREELNQMLSEKPNLTYQELTEKRPDILFLWYRLAQIERRHRID